MTAAVEIRRRPRGVVDLILNRPPLNILDLDALGRLRDAAERRAVDAREAEPEALRLIVLRGAGEKGFSAGVAVQDHTPDKIEEMLGRLHDAIRTLRGLPVPTLAVVHGHCLGGGFELAASCDLLLASDDARFAVPEVKLGCFPPVAAALLPRLLGPTRALDLILTGRAFGVEEAERWGLISRRAPRERLEEILGEMEEEILAGSAAVARRIRKAVDAGTRLPFEEALEESERIYLEELAPLEDMEEGLRAFLEKRPPEWRHR